MIVGSKNKSFDVVEKKWLVVCGENTLLIMISEISSIDKVFCNNIDNFDGENRIVYNVCKRMVTKIIVEKIKILSV